jgi:hypothetical protein
MVYTVLVPSPLSTMYGKMPPPPAPGVDTGTTVVEAVPTVSEPVTWVVVAVTTTVSAGPVVVTVAPVPRSTLVAATACAAANVANAATASATGRWNERLPDRICLEILSIDFSSNVLVTSLRLQGLPMKAIGLLHEVDTG